MPTGRVVAEVLLFGSAFLVFFAYFGYPLTLLAAAALRRREVRRAEVEPAVTLIVTVHNEESRIRQKLENALALDYPAGRLQILVASDGSTDRSNEIARSYAGRGVELLALAERNGKESAQKEALARARGDIIVFSDAATAMEPGGLRRLVSNFADPTVGCVSSEDRVLGRDGRPSGEGLYVRYEMWLRALESRAGSLVGLSGSLFAARREVCHDFSAEMQSDFRTVLNSVRLGMRGVSDPGALGLYLDTADPKREWERKVRTVVRGLTVFFRHAALLNVLRYGLFSYQLFCHKLLRWAVPLLLLVALGANAALAGEPAFGALLALQALFYAVGAAGMRMPRWQNAMAVRIPAYFLSVNASILQAWWRYLRGERIRTWAPTRR